MFGWFAPKCPVDTWDKAWTETRMAWLADRLGIDRLLRAEVVLPTDEYFPDPYDGTPESARVMMVRLCGYMGLDHRRITLEVWPDIDLPGAAGHYVPDSEPLIRVAESKLADPHRLVAVLAHELAHEILLGGGHLTQEVEDHEQITDLLPVFLGLGVLTANAVLRDRSWSDGQWHMFHISRVGYLPARVLGYGLALFALAREESSPAWARYLRPDASAALRDGMDYITKTGDTLFHPDTVRARRGPVTANVLADRLATGTPGVRMAALWEVRERAVVSAAIIEAVAGCLHDGDPAIPGEAARVLGGLGPAANPAVPHLRDALGNANPSTRAGAAHALGCLRAEPETIIPNLCVLVRDGDEGVTYEAALALWRYGRQCDAAAGPLLEALTNSLVARRRLPPDVLAGALLATVPDARAVVKAHFRSDPELRRQALEALREAGTDPWSVGGMPGAPEPGPGTDAGSGLSGGLPFG